MFFPSMHENSIILIGTELQYMLDLQILKHLIWVYKIAHSSKNEKKKIKQLLENQNELVYEFVRNFTLG